MFPPLTVVITHWLRVPSRNANGDACSEQAWDQFPDGCEGLSVDPLPPHEDHPEGRFCHGQKPEPTSSALGMDSMSPSGTTKRGVGHGVGGRREAKKG